MLRSPWLALSILTLTMLYAATVAWFPWLSTTKVAPPGWAVRLGLDHPFRSLPFLSASGLLFVNTLACTCDRLVRVRCLWRGDVPSYAASLAGGPADQAVSLLRDSGFRQRGEIWFRNRFALWGGFLLHVGILVIILSVAVQQAFFDGGTFEIADQEMVRLDQPGVVLDREAGYLAPASPPRMVVALDRFDAFQHQLGYAPDRRSRLVVFDPGQPDRTVTGEIDRARGLTVGDTTIYQAIPTGFSLTIEVPGLGVRSVHLREKDHRTAAAEITDPDGEPARFVLEGERSLNDPEGAGQLVVHIERRGQSQLLGQGEPFRFGPGSARVIAISRWGGFTYARARGIGLVFSGFSIALVGCFLLLFPAGVARFEDGAVAPEVRVYLSRGIDLLMLEWRKHQVVENTLTCKQ